MATETLHISLPDNLKRYVEERVADGGYGNTSEYVRELIRADRDQSRRQAEQRLEALLVLGLESGDPMPMTREDWDAVRTEALARLEARNRDAAQG